MVRRNEGPSPCGRRRALAYRRISRCQTGDVSGARHTVSRSDSCRFSDFSLGRHSPRNRRGNGGTVRGLKTLCKSLRQRRNLGNERACCAQIRNPLFCHVARLHAKSGKPGRRSPAQHREDQSKTCGAEPHLHSDPAKKSAKLRHATPSQGHAAASLGSMRQGGPAEIHKEGRSCRRLPGSGSIVDMLKTIAALMVAPLSENGLLRRPGQWPPSELPAPAQPSRPTKASGSAATDEPRQLTLPRVPQVPRRTRWFCMHVSLSPPTQRCHAYSTLKTRIERTKSNSEPLMSASAALSASL